MWLQQHYKIKYQCRLSGDILFLIGKIKSKILRQQPIDLKQVFCSDFCRTNSHSAACQLRRAIQLTALSALAGVQQSKSLLIVTRCMMAAPTTQFFGLRMVLWKAKFWLSSITIALFQKRFALLFFPQQIITKLC